MAYKTEVRLGKWEGVLYTYVGKYLHIGRVMGNLKKKGYDFVVLTYSETVDMTRGWSRRWSVQRGLIGKTTFGTVFYTNNAELKKFLARFRYINYRIQRKDQREGLFRQDLQYNVSSFSSFSKDYQILSADIGKDLEIQEMEQQLAATQSQAENP